MSASRLLTAALLSVLSSAPARLAAQPASAGVAPATPAAPNHAALVRQLDSLATAFLHEAPAAGLTMAVVRGTDTLVLRGYGWADTARHRAAGPTTIYRVGSITKQFTAAAVLQLVDRSRLSLADTLGRFFPQYPGWSRVTIRQLLNHTSGIPTFTGSRAWAARVRDALAPDTVLAFVAGAPFDFAPGTQFRYDNTGYVLLGRLLERLTGRPYAALVRARFFTPLGMTRSTYCPDAPADTAYAAGYDRARDSAAYRPTTPISMTSPYAAGALCTTVPDFLRWQAALTGGRVVRAATYARMSRSDTLADGQATGYGWGLSADALEGHRMVEHGGDINGFSAEQLWFPEDALRVVVFTNTLGSDPGRLAQNVARAALRLPLLPRPTPAAP